MAATEMRQPSSVFSEESNYVLYYGLVLGQG